MFDTQKNHPFFSVKNNVSAQKSSSILNNKDKKIKQYNIKMS